MEKRVYIETYGCQMNEHDTERILRLLEGAHYLETKNAQEADFILVNTFGKRPNIRSIARSEGING